MATQRLKVAHLVGSFAFPDRAAKATMPAMPTHSRSAQVIASAGLARRQSGNPRRSSTSIFWERESVGQSESKG